MREFARDGRPAPQRGGFTLVELMIVIVCMAVAGMLVVPQLSGHGTTRLAEAARLLSADLEFAQASSLAHGDDPRQVHFDTAANRYWIAPRSAPDEPVQDPIGKGPWRTEFGAGRAAVLRGVRIDSLSLGGDDVLQFGPQGELDQVSPARITLTCDGRKVDVTVHPITGETAVSALY